MKLYRKFSLLLPLLHSSTSLLFRVKMYISSGVKAQLRSPFPVWLALPPCPPICRDPKSVLENVVNPRLVAPHVEPESGTLLDVLIRLSRWAWLEESRAQQGPECNGGARRPNRTYARQRFLLPTDGKYCIRSITHCPLPPRLAFVDYPLPPSAGIVPLATVIASAIISS